MSVFCSKLARTSFGALALLAVPSQFACVHGTFAVRRVSGVTVFYDYLWDHKASDRLPKPAVSDLEEAIHRDTTPREPLWFIEVPPPCFGTSVGGVMVFLRPHEVTRRYRRGQWIYFRMAEGVAPTRTNVGDYLELSLPDGSFEGTLDVPGSVRFTISPSAQFSTDQVVNLVDAAWTYLKKAGYHPQLPITYGLFLSSRVEVHFGEGKGRKEIGVGFNCSDGQCTPTEVLRDLYSRISAC